MIQPLCLFLSEFSVRPGGRLRLTEQGPLSIRNTNCTSENKCNLLNNEMTPVVEFATIAYNLLEFLSYRWQQDFSLRVKGDCRSLASPQNCIGLLGVGGGEQ